MWLDGMDPMGTGVTPTTSGNLPVWVDKSGNNFHATAGTKGTGKIDSEFTSTEQLGTECMLDVNMYYGQSKNYCQIPTSVITPPTYDILDNSVNFLNNAGLSNGQYYTTSYTALPEIEHVIAVVELNQNSGEYPLLFGTNYYGRALYFRKINYGADFLYDFMAGQFAWGGAASPETPAIPWLPYQINSDKDNHKVIVLTKYSSNLVEFSWSKDLMLASISAKSYPPNSYSSNSALIGFGCGNRNIWDAYEKKKCIVSACATEENKECNFDRSRCWCGQRTWIGAAPVFLLLDSNSPDFNSQCLLSGPLCQKLCYGFHKFENQRDNYLRTDTPRVQT